MMALSPGRRDAEPHALAYATPAPARPRTSLALALAALLLGGLATLMTALVWVDVVSVARAGAPVAVGFFEAHVTGTAAGGLAVAGTIIPVALAAAGLALALPAARLGRRRLGLAVAGVNVLAMAAAVSVTLLW